MIVIGLLLLIGGIILSAVLFLGRKSGGDDDDTSEAQESESGQGAVYVSISAPPRAFEREYTETMPVVPNTISLKATTPTTTASTTLTTGLTPSTGQTTSTTILISVTQHSTRHTLAEQHTTSTSSAVDTSRKSATRRSARTRRRRTTRRAISARRKSTARHATFTSQNATVRQDTVTRRKPLSKRSTITSRKPTTRRVTVTRRKPTTRLVTFTSRKSTTRQATITRPKPRTRRATVTWRKPGTRRVRKPRTRRTTVTRPKTTTRLITFTSRKSTTRQVTITRPKPRTRRATVTWRKPGTRRVRKPRTRRTTVTRLKTTTRRVTFTSRQPNESTTKRVTITSRKPTTRRVTVTEHNPITILATSSQTISTTTTLKPRLSAKTLLCVLGDEDKFPPADLCDVLVYDSNNEDYAPFLNPMSIGTAAFARKTTEKTITKYAIQIPEKFRNEAMRSLQKPSGQDIVQQLWAARVRSYAFLELEVSPYTDMVQVSGVVSMVKTLRRLQHDLEGRTKQNGYIILGVAVMEKETKDNDHAYVQMLQEIMSEAKPDALVYVTSFNKEFFGDTRCRAIGPSAWARPTIPDQPTFVNALELRKLIGASSTVTELLSLSISGRWASFKELDDQEEWDDIITTQSCTSIIRLGYQDKGCPRGSQYASFHAYPRAEWHDVKRQHKYIRTKTWSFVMAYDDNITMATKMCRAAKEYDFHGGWAVFDLEFSDSRHLCPDDQFKDGLRLVHWIKHHMNQGFSGDCSSIRK
ncbi:uncharacterized protein LOC135388227 isoform X2 [Ornithodoros turicata]